MNISQESRRKEALRMARFWIRRCQELGITLEGINVNVNAPKEERKEEAGKENLPPTPPIREKGEEGKQEEKVSSLVARAREANEIPSLDEVRTFVASHLGTKYPSEAIDAWYEHCQLSGWRDRKGDPIRNWGCHLSVFLRYYAFNTKQADPERLPDVRNQETAFGSRYKADNWRGTKKENLSHVLG